MSKILFEITRQGQVFLLEEGTYYFNLKYNSEYLFTFEPDGSSCDMFIINADYSEIEPILNDGVDNLIWNPYSLSTGESNPITSRHELITENSYPFAKIIVTGGNLKLNISQGK